MIPLLIKTAPLWLKPAAIDLIIGFAISEIRQWGRTPPAGLNSDKIPVKPTQPSQPTTTKNFNTQNNNFNYTQSVTTNTNIYNNTTNTTFNINIPSLPSRNLPQQLTGGGSTNTTLRVANTVKKSLANRRYGSLLTSPFYDRGETITFFNDLDETQFLSEIESDISDYTPPTLADGELPDAIETALAFISFSDQGNAVPVPSVALLNKISTYYGARSKTTGFEVTGLINIGGVSIVTQNQTPPITDYPPLFIDSSQSQQTLWDLLGYSEEDFRETSIEQIIKDFRGKIYDRNDEDNLLPIGENFETTEQFIAGSIATLLYKGGFDRFPIEIELPDNTNIIFKNNVDYLEYLLENLSENEEEIWELLGYDEDEFKEMTIEDLIKDFGEKIYQNKKVVSLTDKVLNNIDDKFENLPQLLLGTIASIFYRSGLHRLPGKLPESLSFDTDKYDKPEDQPSVFVEDMMEYQEYLIKNLDEIFGRFPINFTYKMKDDNGQEQDLKIKFDNISECLLELSGLAIDNEKTLDIQTSLMLKNLRQTLTGSSAAILGTDIGHTIMDFLGFDYDEFERKIKVPVTPESTTIKDFLKESEASILGIKQTQGETDVKTLINKVTAYAGIAAAAVSQKRNFITGEAIRDSIKEKQKDTENKYDAQWADLIEQYNTVAQTARSKFPNARVKNRNRPNSPNTP